ncbi:MAG: RNA polymerase sigma factor [Eubacteriaceae bacterium]|jgi:RNA polymerase sigma-70 factor (ECF subfamily)|nr:RNA polymerase sigma factor [Eubacteriaceae bacterium]
MERKLLVELYDAYSRELLLYLAGLCHDFSLAEDLMQETFLKAILSLPKNHTNMRAWLYMTARNLCISHMRKSSRETLQSDDDDADSVFRAIGGSTGGPLAQLLENERNRALFQALSGIDVRNREVLILQYFGGLGQNEIARILGLTASNVRVLAYRGKQKLRKLLEEAGYNDIS